MKTSESGIAFLKLREGFSPKAYRDGRGWSIGHGTFIDTAAEQYLLTATIDRAKADQLLRADLVRFERTVNSAIDVSISQSQFDALISLCYNIGETAFSKLTLVTYINQGKTIEVIKAIWIKSYVTSAGKYLDSLYQRRILESNLFAQNVDSVNYTLPIILIIIIIYFIYKNE